MVELFRRGCTRIVCFDASEDGGHPLTALGQSFALARDELGVGVDINVKHLWPGSAKDPRDERIASSMCAVGRITYPGGRDGVLIVVKNRLPPDAPLDVRTYAETNLKFPFDSTIDQFFDDKRFDAYRELGYHGGALAGQKLKSVEGVLQTSWD